MREKAPRHRRACRSQYGLTDCFAYNLRDALLGAKSRVTSVSPDGVKTLALEVHSTISAILFSPSKALHDFWTDRPQNDDQVMAIATEALIFLHLIAP